MSSRLANGPVADRWARRWGWALITLAVLLVYWPLSTFAYGLVHGDTLDCWVPWRWFIAQALQDGHFPLWNPYAQGGYPIYADLQGPAWYPPSIALGGTIGHTLYTLQALFLGYVIVGGIGMMRLVRLLQRDARIGLVIGLAYALSGFFTAHQMHFYAVISAAWLPWLLAAQLKLMDRPTWRSALEAALFQACCSPEATTPSPSSARGCCWPSSSGPLGKRGGAAIVHSCTGWWAWKPCLPAFRR